MGYNSKELRVSKDPKKPSKPKDTDYVSKMGYRDDSPFRNQEAINIYTPNGTIDMSNTGIPLMANGRYLPPYSGQHQFDTTNVLEQRMASGGEVDADKAYSFLVAKSIYGHPLSAAQTKAFARIAGVQVDGNGDIIEEGEEGDDEAVSYDDQDTEEMSYEKRGGSTRGKRTSKNIKTSVNKLLQRNAMLYGPSGKNLYDPNFKTGGWLDQYQPGGPKIDRSLMGQPNFASESVQSQAPMSKYAASEQNKAAQQAAIEGAKETAFKNFEAKNKQRKEHPGYTQAQLDAIQNKIDNPWTQNPGGTLASMITSLAPMSEEDVYKTYANPLEALKYSGKTLGTAAAQEMGAQLLGKIPGIGNAVTKGYGKAMDYLARKEGLNEAQIALGQQMRTTLPGAAAELYHIGKYYRPGKETLMPYVEKIGNVMKKPLNELLFSGNRVPVAEGIANYNPLKALGKSNLLGLSTAYSAAKAANHFANTTLPEITTLNEHPNFDEGVKVAKNVTADALSLVPALNTKVSDLFAPGNWANNDAIHKLERFLAGKLLKDPIKSEVTYAEKKKGGASNEWLPVDHYQDGGITVRELWEKTTGTPWKEAHDKGLTDGSYEMNMALRSKLLGQNPKALLSHPAILPAHAIHAPVPQQVAAKVQQAPMPRIDSSLMGRVYNPSETVQSQSPLNKYAAAEQNKAAVKDAIQIHAENAYNDHLERENLRKKYTGKSDEEIKRIQEKINNPWINEPSGQLASYLTRLHGLDDDEIASITGAGTMGNRLGLASDLLGWGLANEVGGKIIGESAGYLADKAPIMWDAAKRTFKVVPDMVNAATKKIATPLDNLMLSGFKKAEPAAFGITNPLTDAERLAIQDARTIGKKMDVFEKPDYRPNLIKGQGYSSTQAADIYERERVKTLMESNANPTVLKKYGYTPKTLAEAHENLIVKNQNIKNLVESKADDAAIEAAGYTRKELNAAYKNLFPKNEPSMVKGADGELVPWTYENKTLKPIEKVLDVKGVKPNLLKDVKVERGSVDNPFFGKQSNPVIEFFRKRGVVPAIERQYMPLATEAEHAMMNTNTVMANLFGKDVVSPGKEIIKVLSDVEAQPKGFAFKGSNSLSSDSFGLYNKTATAAIEKGQVEPTLLGYQKLNDFGYSEQAGVNKQSILNMLNEQIGQFNKAMQGKYKLPNAFVKGKNIMYPDMGLIRKQFGGGQSMPYVHYQLGGGWLDELPTAQAGVNWIPGAVSQKDSVRNMAGNQMRWEHSRGDRTGIGLGNYGNPDLATKLGRNPTEQEAVDNYMETIYPQVKDKYPTAMEQVTAGDLLYNAGKEAYNYLNWDTRKDNAASDQNWDQVKQTLDTDARRKALNNARDKYYKNTAPKEYKDRKTGKTISYDYGKNAQGEFIKDTFGAMSPAYENTWYGRQHASDQYKPHTEQDFTDKTNPLFYPKKPKVKKLGGEGWLDNY